MKPAQTLVGRNLHHGPDIAAISCTTDTGGHDIERTDPRHASPATETCLG